MPDVVAASALRSSWRKVSSTENLQVKSAGNLHCMHGKLQVELTAETFKCRHLLRMAEHTALHRALLRPE